MKNTLLTSLAAAIFIFSPIAHSSDNELGEICSAYADFAELAASKRDKGEPETNVLLDVIASDLTRTQKKVYQDATKAIYNHPQMIDLPPELIGYAFFMGCMQG